MSLQVGDAAAMQRELVEHLADNTIGGDAIMAAHALYRMGPGVLPALGAARPYLDAQALQLVDLIEQNLRAPAPRSARGRARLPAITTVYADPVLSFDIRRSPVPKW